MKNGEILYEKILNVLFALILSIGISFGLNTKVYAQQPSTPYNPINVDQINSREASKSTTQSINYIGVTYTIKTTVHGTINYSSTGAAVAYSLDYYGTWLAKPTAATITYKDVSYEINGANVLAHFTVGIIVGGKTTWGLAKTLVL